MKLYSTIFTCLLALLLVLPAAAQKPPGYLGKRLILGYEAVTFPAWVNPNAGNNTGVFTFNYKHTFFADYAVSRTGMIGLVYKRYNTYENWKTTSMNYRGISELTGETCTGNATPNLNGQIRASHVGFNYKSFSGSSSVAPFGNYVNIGLDLVSYRAIVAKNTFLFNDFECGNIRVDPFRKVRYYTAMLLIGFGKQRILFDKITLNYGASLAGIFGTIDKSFVLEGNGFSQPTGLTNSDYIPVTTRWRLMSHNMFNLHLGIGWLAK